ncbi:hypothetical protein I4100191B2_17250 [Clostridiales bacterium]
MKEGAAHTGLPPLFLYNVSKLEKVPLTGPLGGVFLGGRGWGDVLSAYPGQIFHQPLSVSELISGETDQMAAVCGFVHPLWPVWTKT